MVLYPAFPVFFSLPGSEKGRDMQSVIIIGTVIQDTQIVYDLEANPQYMNAVRVKAYSNIFINNAYYAVYGSYVHVNITMSNHTTI